MKGLGKGSGKKCPTCKAALLGKRNPGDNGSLGGTLGSRSNRGGQGMGPGGNPAAGGKAQERPSDLGFDKERIKSQRGKGKIVGSWFLNGEPPKGRALEEYSGAHATLTEEANDELSKQKIPAPYRTYVRDYFDSVRLTEKK